MIEMGSWRISVGSIPAVSKQCKPGKPWIPCYPKYSGVNKGLNEAVQTETGCQPHNRDGSQRLNFLTSSLKRTQAYS